MFPIENPGNYCYFIAAFQFFQQIQLLLFGKLAISKSVEVTDLARQFLNKDVPNQQNDANEYLMQLLNCKLANEQSLDNYLMLKYSGITKCFNKGHVNTKNDLVLSMELPIQRSLQLAIDSICNETEVEDYECSGCGKIKQKATQIV